MSIVREEEHALLNTLAAERDSPGISAFRRILEIELERAKTALIDAEPEQIFSAQGHAHGLRLALKYLKA